MRKRLQIGFVFVCLMLSVLAVEGQKGGLLISGFLRDGWKPLSGSLVQLYSQGTLLSVKETNISGKFEFALELNRDYLIVFAAYGYITKRLSINTSVRNDEIKEWDYWFNMELFPDIEEIDFSIFQLPVAKIIYLSNWGEFDFDNNYSEKLRELSSNVTGLVKRERGEQYRKYIIEAENAAKKGNLIKAIDYYLLAGVCDPYSTYPMEQINLADKMLLKKASDYSRYIELQFLGDSCLREHDFSKASVFFKESVRLYPDSDYSWYKKKLADTLYSRFDNTFYKSEKFKQSVAIADNYIRSRDYINARFYYEIAAEILPNDEYVFKQISFLKSMMPNTKYDNTHTEHRKKVDLADKYYNNNDFQKAIENYRLALQVNPSDQYVKIQIDKLEKKRNSIIEFNFSPGARSAEFLKDLFVNYDKGHTVEKYNLDGKEIVRVVINDGQEAREYLKIESQNETTYYRNGLPIGYNVFKTETGSSL